MGGQRRQRHLLGWTGALLTLMVIGLAVLRLVPADPPAAGVPCSRLVRAADHTVLRLTLATDGQYRLWTPLERIADPMVTALLLKEDRFFFHHPGVNPIALARAAWSTWVRGHRQGGSTLTMQLARRLEGLNTRTVAGKLRQIGLALWLEARHSKRDLLEAYCNLVPMGGNIEGVGAAARVYFAKEAEHLTLAESLALAVLPQKPTGRLDFGPEQQQARGRLAAVWRSRHPLASTGIELAEETVVRRGRLPFLAPHFTDALLRKPSTGQEIDTTLDLRLQHLTERLLGRYLAEQGNRGLVNGSVLLVDRRDMAIKALVGSADYFDPAIHGQVNGTAARRSPGSTLKPFVYGLALDQGLIHPLSILTDSPTAFGPFQPENFDGRFAGPIPARDALIRSRNVPAVWLAQRLQAPDLHGFLRTAGVGGLRSAAHYGLSLVLGGGELTMEELVGLYGMLANDGRLRPLRSRRDDPHVEGTPLLSPRAAFLVRDMLTVNPRPDGRPTGGRGWPVAWKTGTSWGFRDAWTVGLVGDYILAVWIGHFDGHAHPSLIGLKAAAPLFLRIADALELTLADDKPSPAQPPPGLIRVEVCAASGDLPNRWCPHTVPTWFMPGVSPIRMSTLHRPVQVETDSGLAACPPFDPGRTRLEVFEFWPTDVQRLFREAGLPRRLPPASAPGCSGTTAITATDEPPQLRSPLANVVYTLRLSKPEESIGLAADLAADGNRLYWFADNRYLGSGERGTTLPWRPGRAGRYELSVVDDLGRSANRTLEVDMLP